MARAGFLIRAAAFLVDAGACMLAAAAVFYGAYFALVRSSVEAGLAVHVASLLFYAVVLPYSFTEVVFARSPGKLLLRLRITRADGTPADKWALTSRWSTKFSAWIIQAVAIAAFSPALLIFLASLMQLVIAVGCLAALGEERRTFHDRWSGTAVCRVPRPGPAHGFDVLIATHAGSDPRSDV